MDYIKLFKSAKIFTPSDPGHPLAGKHMNQTYCFDRGAMLVKNGYIESVGEYEDVMRAVDSSSVDVEVDCGGRCMIPGFVDAHTHACFIGLREREFLMRLNHASYLDIHKAGGGINCTVSKVRNATPDELCYATMEITDRAMKHGTTSMEIKSGYGLTVEQELKLLRVINRVGKYSPIDIVPTFLGAHCIPEEYKGRENDYTYLIVNDMIPKVASDHLARFCDVACDEGFFSLANSRRILTAARSAGLGTKMHGDELGDFGAAALAAELKVDSVEHLLMTNDNGLEALSHAGVLAVLLPATAFCLKDKYARARKMIEGGMAVALATDCNPGSCYCESMEFVFSLAVLGMDMSVDEALTAATLNSAYAIGLGGCTGSLDKSKKADFILLDGESPAIIPYNIGTSAIQTVCKMGEIVYEK